LACLQTLTSNCIPSTFDPEDWISKKYIIMNSEKASSVKETTSAVAVDVDEIDDDDDSSEFTDEEEMEDMGPNSPNVLKAHQLVRKCTHRLRRSLAPAAAAFELIKKS
jgi:hypothetical protein